MDAPGAPINRIESERLRGTGASERADLFRMIKDKLRLPLVVAPMFRVSGPELVIAACRAGAIGTFPTANAQTPEELDGWLTQIRHGITTDATKVPTYAANLIINQPRLEADLACLVRHQVELVITSVGSPKAVVPALHDAGALVFADVASILHARKAIDARVDGLVLLSAGAGGQTGWLNGFAFVRAVREFFDGPIVLAGGISDGIALRAAEVLGCTLGYMGTRFIASRESLAPDWYRQMVVESGMDDILLTAAVTGLPTSMLKPSIVRAGLDPARLDEQITPQSSSSRYGGGGPQRWVDIVSAGHSVSGAMGVAPVDEIIDELAKQYSEAKECP